MPVWLTFDGGDALLGVHELAGSLPSWLIMWLVALTLFFLAKFLSVRAAASPRFQGREMASFLFFWVGMDISAFLNPKTSGAVSIKDVAPPAGKLLLGTALLWIFVPTISNPICAALAGLIGMVLLLHFGLFHLLAILWQFRGVPVEPIMQKPLLSRTLGEFWGQRWNRAFNDLMVRFVFLPGRKRFGVVGAAFLSFLVSGLIHDLVISVPAGGGYGLPTLYFVIQFFGLVFQKIAFARAHSLQSGTRGRLFTLAMTGLPLPLLFHQAFLNNVIIPFLGVIGAIRDNL